MQMALPPIPEHEDSDEAEIHRHIRCWPAGRRCACVCRIPLGFEDAEQEQRFRQGHFRRLQRALRRTGIIALIAHLLAVLSELYAVDLARPRQAEIFFLSCMSIMAVLSSITIFVRLSEAAIVVIYSLAAVAIMLTTRSRAAELMNMDIQDAYQKLPETAILSDAITIGNLACLIVVYYVILPIRAAVGFWLSFVVPIVYLAFTISMSQKDGTNARTLSLALRLLICGFVGLVGRCWIELQDRAAFLRIAQANKDLTMEKVLRCAAEHTLENGPFASEPRRQSPPTSPKVNLDDVGLEEMAQPDMASMSSTGHSSSVSRPLSSIIFTPAGHRDVPVAMQLKAMKAVAAEEKWLIQWSDLSFKPELLGRGGFAMVMEGRYGGAKVAVKLPLRDHLSTSPEIVDFCGKELRVLRHLRHPFIVTFYGACIEESKQIILLVEEYVEGLSLFDTLLNDGAVLGHAKPTDDIRQTILAHICQALVYLHDQGPSMLHGDLSPKNVLLRKGSWEPVLVDFGMSVLRNSRQRLVGGSPRWMAPELLANLENGGLAPECSMDMYSFGRLAFFVSTGELPLKNLSIQQLIEKASSRAFSEMLWMEPERATNLQILCEEQVCPACMAWDPKERCSAEDVLRILKQDFLPSDSLTAVIRVMKENTPPATPNTRHLEYSSVGLKSWTTKRRPIEL